MTQEAATQYAYPFDDRDSAKRRNDAPTGPEPRSFGACPSSAYPSTDWDIIALRYLEEDPENG